MKLDLFSRIANYTRIGYCLGILTESEKDIVLSRIKKTFQQ